MSLKEKQLHLPIPELNYLLSQVEKHFGSKAHTSADFELLSSSIEKEIHEMISVSTLKRLWGYVSSNPTPRRSTLDVLSRYAGYKDFDDFCRIIQNQSGIDSAFFTAQCLTVSELEEGEILLIGWNPNRLVELEYTGNHQFRVIRNENSSLEVGDSFEASSFMIGYPLYIPRILRDGEFTSAYIAGVQDGLTLINRKKVN